MTGIMMMASGNDWLSGKVNPLPGGTNAVDVFGSGTAVAGWRFNTNGTVDKREGAVYTFDHNWWNGTPPAGLYIKATVLNTPGTDAFGGSTTGSWLALSSAQEWTLSKSSPTGTKENSFQADIATDSGGTNIIATSSSPHYILHAGFES